MSKLIQSNPYGTYSDRNIAWAAGFEAGQKSTLAPASVTGRWWLSNDNVAYFIYPSQYKYFQRQADNKSDCRWLTEEETREFE